MRDLVHAIRPGIDVGCLVDGVGKGRCRVSLADAPEPRAIVDLDAAGSPLGGAQAKCDFLLFADPSLVVAMELKDGNPNVTRAANQLQAGANAAYKLVPRDLPVIFRPVLVSRGIRRQQQIELRKGKVRFRRRAERIRRIPCGAALTEVLGDS